MENFKIHLTGVFLLLVISCSLMTVSAPAQDTFSIVAVDSVIGIVGGAGASCVAGVIVISDVHPGVGGIHTQARWLPSNQDYARTLMNQGHTPQQIIDSLVAHDAEGDPTRRQYGIVDLVSGGRSAGYTGINCPNYKNHILGPNYAIAGNTLSGQQILASMQARFLNTAGSLEERLMAALQGAKVPGADTRCMASGRSSISAFIRVAWPGDTTGALYLDLNVDDMPAPYDPIDSLQILYDQWKQFPYLNIRSIAFGRYEVGERSDSVTITVTNYGVDTLTIFTISEPDSHFVLSGLPILPAVLAPFQRLAFSVSFVPQSPGSLLDTIVVTSNDSLHPAGIIRLTGRGVVIGQAQAGVLYATSGSPSSQMYTVNTSTGVATAIGPLGVTEIQGLAVRPTTNELYGTLSGFSSTTLYRISAAQGDALPAVTVPVGNMRAIDFSAGDTLYGATTGGKLYRIDLFTGDTVFIGTAQGIAYSGLSFSPTGVLWASVRPPLVARDAIYIVNTSNGDTTRVGLTGDNAITPSITFSPYRTLYGLKGSGAQINRLIQIDTLTAVGTLIDSMGVSGLLAITMRTDSLVPVSVPEPLPSTLLTSFVLEQNYPDPFNPTTVIRYQLPVTSHVTLKVYNVLGQEVATLVNEEMKPGSYEVTWDASGVASGIYFYRLQAGSFAETRKLVLLR